MLEDIPEAAATRARGFVGRAVVLEQVSSWLADPHAGRILLLTGHAGTGKTALMAWLAGQGEPPVDERLRGLRKQVADAIDAAYFCTDTRSASEATLDPSAFGQSLLRQFSRRFQDYGAALLEQEHRRQIVGTVDVDTNYGDVAGVRIGTLYAADPAGLYSSVMRALSDVDGDGRQVVVLVDGLDESELWRRTPRIGELVANQAGLPARVRFVVSTRPVPAVLGRLPTPTPIDLDTLASGHDDVVVYVRNRLAGADDALVDRIAATSGGNFLVAKMAVDFWEQHGTELTHDGSDRLDDVYATYLRREYDTPDNPAWTGRARPLLATLGAAAAPLGPQQLGLVLDDLGETGLQDALSRCRPYLAGERPDGPFSLYHLSFQEFLFDRDGNPDFAIPRGDAHGRIADRYLAEFGADWTLCDDAYGLAQVAGHLLAAAEHGAAAHSRKRAERLAALVADGGFREQHLAVIDDVRQLLATVELGVEGMCLPDVTPKPTGVVRSIAAVNRVRAEHVDARKIFALAATGDDRGAEQRLDVLPLEDRWRQACGLLAAWLVGERDVPAGRRILTRLQPELPAEDDHALDRLAAWVDAALDGRAPPPAPPGPPPSADVVHGLVERIRGSRSDAELLSYAAASAVSQLPWLRGVVSGHRESIDADTTSYLGALDGPHLVSLAIADPARGDPYLDLYIAVLATNAYALYRNRSLWGLLASIVTHPDGAWVQRRVREIAEAAIGGAEMRVAQDLDIARLVLPELVAGARAALDAAVGDARAEALADGSDAWGWHKRRLAALAEVSVIGYGDATGAAALVDAALAVPHGFAGYEAPACLRLAEAAHLSDSGDRARVAAALGQALEAAHCVQDPIFCARTTSRCNAIALRWLSAPFRAADATEAEALVARFRKDPFAPEFSAVHLVGEDYAPRQPPPAHLPFSHQALEASTLEALARLYERPLADLTRLNPGIDPVDVLPDGHQVAISDREFAPWVATRIAAEVLVAPGLTRPRRAALVRSLLPHVLADAECVDTVLARYLLVARSDDAELLAALDERAAAAGVSPPARPRA